MTTKDLKAKNWDILVKWLAEQNADELRMHDIVRMIAVLNRKVIESYLQKET